MTTLTLDLAEANEAINFWLNEAVLQKSVIVETIKFQPNFNRFEITLRQAAEQVP